MVCVSSNLFFRKLELIIFGANSLIKSEYFFPRDSNWRFFPLSRKLVSISTCTPKIGSLLCVDCEILNREFFFHKQYGTFIPKWLPTSNSCCFKTNKAIELEPKQIIARTQTASRRLKQVHLKNTFWCNLKKRWLKYYSHFPQSAAFMSYSYCINHKVHFGKWKLANHSMMCSLGMHLKNQTFQPSVAYRDRSSLSATTDIKFLNSCLRIFQSLERNCKKIKEIEKVESCNKHAKF